MKLIIDRFKDEFAVVELPDGQMIDCPKKLLPDNAKEGSVLTVTVDETVTSDTFKRITKRMNKLFKD